MRHKTTTLLAVIAALFAVDIALRVSPREAVAQPDMGMGRPITYTGLVLDIHTTGGPFLYRLGSDGVIEYRRITADLAGDPPRCCAPFFGDRFQAVGPGWQEIVPELP